MQENEPLTITEISGEAWNKPGSQQYWYTVIAEGHTSEPSKYIQDKDKGVAEPEVGKTYQGRWYGNKFYPDKPRTGGFGGGRPKDSSGQKHGNALKIAADYLLSADKKPQSAKEFVEALRQLAQAIYEIPVPSVKPSGDSAEVPAKSGYEKAKEAQRALPKQDVVHDVPPNDSEFQNALASRLSEEEPINLDDIPF